MTDWMGYRWLAEHYGAEPAQPFRVDSQSARSRSTVRENGYVHEYYPPAARPADGLAGHLSFALKHEGIHLEFLSRLFTQTPADELEKWIASEPTGQFDGVTAGHYDRCLSRKRIQPMNRLRKDCTSRTVWVPPGNRPPYRQSARHSMKHGISLWRNMFEDKTCSSA